jgi:predicted site-specific integrase-resolvase
MTPEEVAAILQVSLRTLAEWRRDGIGPPWVAYSRKIVRYNREKFDAWLATQ